MGKLDVPGIFKSYADSIIRTREEAINVHGSNIRAAGNDVEIQVRETLGKILPRQFYVTSGHIIDINNNISNQLDIIISDNFSLRSLLTTRDGTEYVPIDSVYAVGEVKSTYRSLKDIERFSDVVDKIRSELHHEEVVNTAFDGVKNDTLIRDVVLEKGNKILNRIFYFMVFVSGEDFNFEGVCNFYNQRKTMRLPDMVVLLNKGIVFYGKEEGRRFFLERYPEQQEKNDYDWCFGAFRETDTGSLEGNHLGYLYYTLLNHLVNSHLEPPTISKYVEKTFRVPKDSIKTARDTSKQSS
jgi:hypothetical protein